MSDADRRRGEPERDARTSCCTLKLDDRVAFRGFPRARDADLCVQRRQRASRSRAVVRRGTESRVASTVSACLIEADAASSLWLIRGENSDRPTFRNEPEVEIALLTAANHERIGLALEGVKGGEVFADHPCRPRAGSDHAEVDRAVGVRGLIDRVARAHQRHDHVVHRTSVDERIRWSVRAAPATNEDSAVTLARTRAPTASAVAKLPGRDPRPDTSIICIAERDTAARSIRRSRRSRCNYPARDRRARHGRPVADRRFLSDPNEHIRETAAGRRIDDAAAHAPGRPQRRPSESRVALEARDKCHSCPRGGRRRA